MRALCSERPTGLRPRTPAADALDVTDLPTTVFLLVALCVLAALRHLLAPHGDCGQISCESL